MIDKSIRPDYVMQGKVKNYLGKQKMVKAQKKWKSAPNHPETELAYITKAEKDALVKMNLHGSIQEVVQHLIIDQSLITIWIQHRKDLFGQQVL